MPFSSALGTITIPLLSWFLFTLSALGIEHFAELAAVRDVAAQFEQPEYAGWRSLRALEDSRFIGNNK